MIPWSSMPLPSHYTDHRFATGWTVRRSNPGGGEIFRNHPDPASCTMGIGYLPAEKRTGLGVDYPPTSSVEVKETVEL
jgi:hypothetical protein